MLLLLTLACADPEPVGFTLKLSNLSSPGEGLATDGTAYDLAFAPGLVVVHSPEFRLFAVGEASPYAELEALAEDGEPTRLATALGAEPDVHSTGFLQYTNEVDYEAAPMGPGASAYTTADIAADQRFSVLFMYGQSNDVIIAGLGLAAFDPERAALDVDLASSFHFYDLGTELNQEPGVGADQAPRQSAPGEGAAEDVPVEQIIGTDDEGYTYPESAELLSLALYPTAAD